MSKREEFIAAINILSAASQSITTEQRIGLLQQAVQQYGLSADDADEVLKASGLIVGERKNYFEILGLSIGELQNQSDTIIAAHVDEAHKKLYSESLRAGGLPRPDGRTQEQWRNVLNQARDTLKDPQKRSEHIATLQTEILQSVDLTSRQEFPTPEKTSLGISTPEDMVLIPAGEFQMGSDNEKVNDREKPVSTVYVDTFYMDKSPVTNAQYKMFLETNPHWRKPSKGNEWNKAKKRMRSTLFIYRTYHDGNYLKHWDGNNFPIGKADHPVTHVSWYAAMAYSQWAGKRLPTEAEWEKAARGGLTGRKYPWGNTMDSNMVYCGKNVGETTSVGKYPANNYGLHDIVGNVWEWCLDEYAPNYYTSSPVRNPVAGASTKEGLDLLLSNFLNISTDRVLRGGSLFTSSEPIQIAIRRGHSPLLTKVVYSTKFMISRSTRFAANIGFRCAWDTQLKSNHYKLF
ncbi:MAG: SUMF1/EgtB/PvdO family nonheme iron enzyme [Candidatus Poribacteria bacterium]|nr:SUMF1/EgtB/PvdO family nonheme iron enzyme [Candidatus Poribacteria bacterium]